MGIQHAREEEPVMGSGDERQRVGKALGQSGFKEVNAGVQGVGGWPAAPRAW